MNVNKSDATYGTFEELMESEEERGEPREPEVPHYKQHPSGIQPKDFCGEYTYNIGTAMAYLFRSPYKHDDPLEDIIKARDHLDFEIYRLRSKT